MKIVVCVKQVPDTKGGVKFNPDGTLDRGAMLTIMNPDDKAGLEAALRIKDEYGAEVTVLTMGLPKADEVLREAMAMGADKGILVTDRVLGGADTWATSTTLAGALRNLDYDLIITGRQAIDGDTAQVGPQISEHLDIPVISYAEDIKIDGDSVVVQRQYEDRYHILKAKMPCLVTALAELNEPKVPKDKKAVLGKMAYYLEGVKEFPKQLSQNMTLTFNSKEYSGTEDIMLFLVANSKSVGGFADAAPLASVSDGYLDVMIIKKMALLTEAPDLIFKLFQGEHPKHPSIEYFQTKELSVLPTEQTAGIAIDYDGEILEEGLPVDISIVPEALNLIILRTTN